MDALLFLQGALLSVLHETPADIRHGQISVFENSSALDKEEDVVNVECRGRLELFNLLLQELVLMKSCGCHGLLAVGKLPLVGLPLDEKL